MSLLEILKEFDGIIGALSGVVVTLLYTEYLKNKGKLSIYIVDYRGKFYTFADRSTGRQGKTDSDYHDYSFELKLNLFNSSDTPKIMRNIIIEFKKNSQCVFEYTPKDTSTRRSSSHIYIVDEISVNNISPKEIQQLELEGHINELNLDTIKEVDQIDFVFIDEKNKKQRKLIFSGEIHNTTSS